MGSHAMMRNLILARMHCTWPEDDCDPKNLAFISCGTGHSTVFHTCYMLTRTAAARLRSGMVDYSRIVPRSVSIGRVQQATSSYLIVGEVERMKDHLIRYMPIYTRYQQLPLTLVICLDVVLWCLDRVLTTGCIGLR